MPKVDHVEVLMRHLGGVSTVDECLHELVAIAVQSVGAEVGFAFMLDRDHPVAFVTQGIAFRQRAESPAPVEKLAGLCHTASTGEAFRGSSSDGFFASFSTSPIRSLMSVPIGRDRTGVLAVGRGAPRVFAKTDLPQLARLAQFAAPTLKHVSLLEARKRMNSLLASVLQRRRPRDLVQQIADSFRCCECSLWVKPGVPFSTDSREIRLCAAFGLDVIEAERPWDYSYPLGVGLTGLVAATGESLHIEDLSNPEEVRTKAPGLRNSDAVWSTHPETSRHFLGLPLLLHSGEVVGVLRLNRAGDATDFTETEVEQLQQLAKAIGTIYVSVEAMDCLGAILDRVHEPVVSTVREASGKEAAPSAWRIEYANSAALAAFSYSSDEFIGQDARELYGPPAAHAVRKRLKIRSSVRRLPTTFAHKTQGRIPVLLSATVGESVLFGQRRTLGHIVDVEQTMSEQLARAREMATVFAHEIGVPILGIVADVESLIAELPEGLADMLELAEHIRVQMDVLLGKSGDLVVQFAPSRDLKRKTEYVDSIVEDVLALYRALARRKGVIIEALRVSGRVRASVHAAQYKQIIRNLVHNAVKYSYFGTASRDRTIRSTVYYADEHAVFEISNYGVGIRPHEIELIWHAGYRGELAKAEDRVGSGIGLASVKRIVDLHNGHVRCESRPLVDPTGPWLTKFIVSVPRGSGGK